MTIRLEDAANAAVERKEMHHAYISTNDMSQDEVMLATISPDCELGWRLTLMKGVYDGTLDILTSGHPTPSALRNMQNLVFHPSGIARLHPKMPTTRAIRELEGYGEEIDLHPHACRTLVEACKMADRRIPIRTPSPFVGIHRLIGVVAFLLVAANFIAVCGIIATWGEHSSSVRAYVLATTLLTLGVLAFSPFLIKRMSEESQRFVSSKARDHSRSIIMQTGQMIILLAIVSTTNGIFALS